MLWFEDMAKPDPVLGNSLLEPPVRRIIPF